MCSQAKVLKQQAGFMSWIPELDCLKMNAVTADHCSVRFPRLAAADSHVKVSK